MDNATQLLNNRNSQAAVRDQQEAIRQLKEALAKVQSENKDDQEAKKKEKSLSTLRQMAEAVLHRHEGVRNQTEPLAAQIKDVRPPSIPLSLCIELQSLAREEGQLVTNVTEMIDLLEKDATTVLVPVLMGQIRDDMVFVRDLLAKNVADQTVLAMEDTVTASLKDLLEVLVEVEKKKQQGSGGKKGGGKKGGGKKGGGKGTPLLPETAELKLVRQWQSRLNRSTETVVKSLGGREASGETKEQLRRHAERQKEIAESVNRLLGEAAVSEDTLEVK